MTFRTALLPILFATVLLAGGVGIAPLAYAQTPTACTGSGSADDCPSDSTCNIKTGVCERTITSCTQMPSICSNGTTCNSRTGACERVQAPPTGAGSCLTTGCPAGSMCSVGSGQCVQRESPPTSGGGSVAGPTGSDGPTGPTGGGGSAGTGGGDNADFTLDPLTDVVDEILDFIDSTVVPAIFAIAFIVFIWGIYTYFILGGANEEKRSEGKQLALWGLVGFFVMVSVWGLVNILVGTLGPSSGDTPCLPQISGECAE